MPRSHTSPEDPGRSNEEMPARIGPYLPVRLLGRGGMATVYLATAPDGSRVAVKWLARPTPNQVRRFQREIDAMRRLHHRHVVRWIGEGIQDGRPFLVMEYIEGQDLRLYASKLKQRPAAERYTETCRIGAEICDALQALHALGLVHRDLKPSNVLLDASMRSFLADFGVVKDADERVETELTAAGVLVGTTGFAAPEQLLGGGVDHRADLYGLGCTLYFLLTCERPFPSLEREVIVRAHLRGEIPLASSVDPDVPPHLDTVIARLMAKGPDERYANAAEVRVALEAGLQQQLPAPLAGRRRYVDAVRESLLRAAREEGRVIRPVGPRGSGRTWLMEVAVDLARRLDVPVVRAKDGVALHSALARLRRGERVAVITPIEVPRSATAPVDEIRLEPLGMADVRRTVVSVAPRTPEPHVAAERLHRASGGHPAWLLEMLRLYTRDQVLDLPDPVPPPPQMLDRAERLTYEAMETLGALAVLGDAADAELLEAVVQMPVEEALDELQDEALVVRHEREWALMGDAVARAVPVPDPVAVHRRAAAALEARGQATRALLHREAAGDVAPGSAGEARDNTRELEQIEVLALQGRLEQAKERLESLLSYARGHRQRELEVRCTRTLGQVLLDLGQAVEAEARLADAVALARALQMHAERRHAHVLRAIATLESRPGSHSAASAALDRLHRALTRVEVEGHDPTRALALAARAQASATLGDMRSREMAEVAAEAELPQLPDALRLRVQLRLARAARAAGDRASARARAEAVRKEAEIWGWRLFVSLAEAILDTSLT